MKDINLIEKINKISISNYKYSLIKDEIYYLNAKLPGNIVGKIYYLHNKQYHKFVPKYEFDKKNVLEIGLKLKDSLLESINSINTKINDGGLIIESNYEKIYEFFIGLKEATCHGLSFPLDVLGFTPTEPQITSGICSFFL